MNFLEMLQNDPNVRAQMDALLGRAPMPAQPAGDGQGGDAPPADAGPGELAQAALWDPSAQTAGPHPDYSPYMGDPFTYGLYGGEHNFYGGNDTAPAPNPAPAPAAAATGPNAPMWTRGMFEPLGQLARGGHAHPDVPAPPGYGWNVGLGYFEPHEDGHDGD